MSLPRSLFKKVRQLEKSTPPPVVAVVTNMRCANKYQKCKSVELGEQLLDFINLCFFIGRLLSVANTKPTSFVLHYSVFALFLFSFCLVRASFIRTA